jgi:Fe-S-cluster containining protein
MDIKVKLNQWLVVNRQSRMSRSLVKKGSGVLTMRMFGGESVDKVRCWWDGETGCFDLEVLDPAATVAEYERVVSQALAVPDAVRKYSDNCSGCSLCCGGRLPLTVVDLYRLKMAGLGVALPLDAWVSAHGSVQRQGECFDITLRQDEEYETCTLWNRDAGLCSVYEKRPLICRTHICAPFSWRASEIRAQIVNAGEDELVIMLGLMDGKNSHGKPQPFAGVLDYGGVLLRDVCSDRLWHYLIKQND